jgi:hypothetical protein
MLTGKCFGVAICLAILAPSGNAAAAFGQTGPAEQSSPEAVAKLIAQLGATEFRLRQQASDQLEKLGAPVLPALRKAAKANHELEIIRRIELVVSRIENALLKAEDKHWQGLDISSRSLKDRLVKILARTPPLSDQQAASAVYLLTVGRPPTDQEVKQAQQQFAEVHGRTLSALQLARSLVQGKEYKAELAATNGRLFKVQADLANEMELSNTLARLNGDEFQKLIDDLAAAVDKTVKADEHFLDVAWLLVLSRFPTATEAKQAIAYLKKAQNRVMATADVFWALMNTKEFVMAR